MCRSFLYILDSDGALWTSSVPLSHLDRLDSDGVLSSSSLGMLACVSHEPAAGHEAVPVDSGVTWAEVSQRRTWAFIVTSGS